MEGNHRRVATGLDDDPYLKEIGPHAVLELSERAEAMTCGG
jgi:hypothetical protein